MGYEEVNYLFEKIKGCSNVANGDVAKWHIVNVCVPCIMLDNEKSRSRVGSPVAARALITFTYTYDYILSELF